MGPFLRCTLIIAFTLVPSIANAVINYSVTFNDPNGDLTAAANLIESHVVAAGKQWADHLVGNANIEVVVRSSAAVPYAEGRSLTNSFVRNNGTFNVFEQGMAAEIRTGIDPNGRVPDVEIEINPSYVYNELWFDPDPYARTATVDVNRTDAMSTFLHEFGHALGYSGWINSMTGNFPGDYQSTYDEPTNFDGANFYFNGPEAIATYGGPVPLTFANVFHVANFAPRPGQDLLLDLMNGLVFYRGSRYEIKPLNIAMLRDAGVPAIYLAGNYDGNGVVDTADYVVWRKGLGTTYTQADYDVWRAHFGQTVGSGSAANTNAAVPEPAAIVLLMLAATGWYLRRRRAALRVPKLVDA